MLLYAGKASISSPLAGTCPRLEGKALPTEWGGTSFKYSLLIDIVKKLKRWSKSASNSLIYLYNIIKTGTSETLRNEIATFTSNELIINFSKENIKKVSIHVPTYLKPCNETQFGQYLAGLIDGDGHFSSKQQLIIVFHLSDISLAYYIKSYLGYGNIRKIKVR